MDRVRLERALLDRAATAGVEVREGAVVRTVDLDTGRLEASGTSPGRAAIHHHTRLIIGADGPRSMVARAAGVDRPVRALRRAGMTFHLADPWPRLPGAPAIARMVIGDGWYCGIAPVPRGRVNIGVVIAERQLRQMDRGHDGALRLVRSILGRLPGSLADWRHAPATDELQVALPLAHRPRRRTGPGFLLVGDAAGFLDPLSGEGLHRALASADLAAAAITRWHRGERGALGDYDHAMSVRSTGKDVLSGLLQLFLARPEGRQLRRAPARSAPGPAGHVRARADRPGATVPGHRPPIPWPVAAALMDSRISIRVAAPPSRVFQLAHDPERWPELLPHYRRVEVRARSGDRILARMVAARQLGPVAVPVTWRAICWPETDDPDDLRLRFRHIRGVTSGMDVTWHIRPLDAGCQVTIEHRFRRPLPLVGGDALPRVIDRWFTRVIAGQTLARFRELAEAMKDVP